MATIKLRLVAEPTGEKCEIVVTRDSAGNRTATASGTWNAEDILRALDREFVLDGPTFLNFITAKPLDRGRTFAGLLGLSDYNAMRQTLWGLANTRAFGNHFDMSAHAATRAHEAKAVADARDAVGRDYVVLTGQNLTAIKVTEAIEHCHQGLAQIGLLAELRRDKAFLDINIEACLDAVKRRKAAPSATAYKLVSVNGRIWPNATSMRRTQTGARSYRMPNNRISIFISLPIYSLDFVALQKRLDKIGRNLPKAG